MVCSFQTLSKSGYRYSADNFELLADVVDRVASIVALVEIQVRDKSPQASLQSESEIDHITRYGPRPEVSQNG